MPNIKQISLILADDSELIFEPKHPGLIKIMRGISKSINGFQLESAPNGKEALIIVCAPDGVLKFFDPKGDIEYWLTEELNK